MPLPVDVIIDEIFPQVRLNGDEATLSFPFGFWIPDDASLLVYVFENGAWTKQTLTTHYTVTRAAEPAVGGTCVFIDAPGIGIGNVVIMRRVTLERLTDFIQGSSLRATVLNLDLDRIVTMIQDLERLALQSLRVADYEDIASLNNEIALNKGEVVRVNDAGDGFTTSSFVSGLGLIHQQVQSGVGSERFVQYQIKDASSVDLAKNGMVIQFRLSSSAIALTPVDSGPEFSVGASGVPLQGIGTATAVVLADGTGKLEIGVKSNGFLGDVYVWAGQGMGSTAALASFDSIPWKVTLS